MVKKRNRSRFKTKRFWKKVLVNFSIVLAVSGVLFVGVPIAVSYAAHDRVAMEGVYDKKGNLINHGWTLNNLLGRVQDGWKTATGNLAQFDNHYGKNGYGSNSNIAKSWLKQKGKLSKEQIKGSPWSHASTKLERQGLYKYAESIGIDPKAYKTNKGLLKAVSKQLSKRAAVVDKSGEEQKRMWGRVGREQANQRKVYNNWTSGLLKSREKLSKKASKEVSDYLAKHGGTKGSDKWYEALEKALNKYATGDAAKELKNTEKKKKKDQENVGEGEKKTTAEDVQKMLDKGEMPEPTTLSGKIGRALLNAFWSSSVSTWLEKSGAGATIFAGATSATQLASDVQNNVMTLVYPAASSYSSMKQVSDWLQPSLIALSTSILVIVLVFSTGRMGAGQAIGDPAQSRAAWYHTLIDILLSSILIASFGMIVNMVLQLNGDILIAFANFMSGLVPEGARSSVFDTAIRLGFDKTTINSIASGAILGGSEFSGVIFEIVYLLAYLGLSIYVKYYYFVRAITFTILIAIGPVFMAFWSSNFGKQRTIAWLRDFLGTVFIQCIHALTITFMALFMDWNNGRITSLTAQQIANMLNWQKANPGKQFLNTITLGLANQGPGSTVDGGSVFSVLVVGFIVIILFKPVSQSLAQLFGISTNMLDNINQSTSRTLKASAIAGGAAAVGLAAAPISAGLGIAKDTMGAAADGVKKANKGAKNYDDFKKNLRNGFNSDFKNGMQKRKPFRKAMARVNTIVGPAAGKLAGTAAGAGTGNPVNVLAMSNAGGAIGGRAARLANKSLESLGLRDLKELGKSAKAKADTSKLANEKVAAANEKTNQGIYDNVSQVRTDKDNGHEAYDPNVANFDKQIKNAEEMYRSGDMSHSAARAKIAEVQAQKTNYNNLKGDAAAQEKINVADARKMSDGNYSNVKNLSAAANSALGSEKSKLAGATPGDADKVQESLALSGAATNGAVMSRYDADGINAKVQSAKDAYASAHKDEFASNGFSSQKEWMDSSQYRSGEAAAVKEARISAAADSNGKVFSMPDQTGVSSFENSMVNRDVFKQEMSKNMKEAGVSQPTQQRVLDAIDGVSGQALVNETPIQGSSTPLKTMDYGLSQKLSRQAAYTINNAGNGVKDAPPVSAFDLAEVFKGDNNPATLIGGTGDDTFSEDTFNDYMDRVGSSSRFQAMKSGLADAYAAHEMNKAAVNDAYDSTVNSDSIMGLGDFLGFDGASGYGNSFNPNRNGYGGSPNDLIASERISNFRSSIGPSGMSPQEAIDELSSNYDSAGQGMEAGSGIPAGDLQLVTENTSSYIRAKMQDGSYQLVGNYGAGDPMLEGSDSIIQNLDITSDGTIGPRYDENTHRFEDPYSEVGDLKVSRGYTNGGPDLVSMLGGYASPVKSSPVDISDFRTMDQAKELQRAEFDQQPMTLDKLGSSYEGYAYYSDGDSGVIVAKDINDNQYKQVSPIVEDDIIGAHTSNQQYVIPLKDSGNGLIPDDNLDPKIYNKGPISSEDEREIHDILRNKMENPIDRAELNSYLNDLLKPTTENTHNIIENNPANQSIGELDLTSEI